MINFSQESKLLNLHPIQAKAVNKKALSMMIPGEGLVAAFTTVRDQVIFTNKRILTVDVQGIGAKKDFVTIPYSRIQYFCVQTPDAFEVIHDSELKLFFADGFVARFEFSGGCDIAEICRVISEYVLQ